MESHATEASNRNPVIPVSVSPESKVPRWIFFVLGIALVIGFFCPVWPYGGSPEFFNLKMMTDEGTPMAAKALACLFPMAGIILLVVAATARHKIVRPVLIITLGFIPPILIVCDLATISFNEPSGDRAVYTGPIIFWALGMAGWMAILAGSVSLLWQLRNRAAVMLVGIGSAIYLANLGIAYLAERVLFMSPSWLAYKFSEFFKDWPIHEFFKFTVWGKLVTSWIVFVLIGMIVMILISVLGITLLFKRPARPRRPRLIFWGLVAGTGLELLCLTVASLFWFARKTPPESIGMNLSGPILVNLVNHLLSWPALMLILPLGIVDLLLALNSRGESKATGN